MDTKTNDVSSFFLVEATGDSESDFDPDWPAADVADVDDAESCSCDVSDNFYSVEPSCYELEEHVPNGGDEEERQDDEVCANGTCLKSCVSADSTNESLTELEKSRLFWEACLAS